MRLVTRKHALERIADHRLARAWVERVALHPDWTEPDPEPGVVRHFGVVAEAGGRVLRVPVVDPNGERHILSAFFDRNARRP